MRTHLLRALSIATLVLVSSNAYAVSFASESIIDPQPFDAFSRDLSRTRTDSTGVVVENDDAIIIAQNLITPAFGNINFNDVVYQHDLSWINPPAGNYISGDLQILAFGNLGGDDVVFSESFSLGSLTPGNFGSLFFSTTLFSPINPVTLNAILLDGILTVTIDKNLQAGFPGNLNAFSVYGSTLSVTYDAVPEPSTWALLGLGLVGVAVLRKRRSA